MQRREFVRFHGVRNVAIAHLVLDAIAHTHFLSRAHIYFLWGTVFVLYRPTTGSMWMPTERPSVLLQVCFTAPLHYWWSTKWTP